MNTCIFEKHYDIIIIGGGATGAGTARDCAMRGLSTLLVERYDFTTGATGRNHGLLHSGARYAVTDQESATECIDENMILRYIAKPYVEEHDGLFITLPEDDLAYQEKFVESCWKAGINAKIIDPKEAIQMEPSVNPTLIGAVQVPDGSIDPFRLTMANVLDAQLHGAQVLTYHEVTGFIIENGRVMGVYLRDNITGEKREARAEITINAAGIWGTLVARMAGVNVSMFPAKGSLLIFGHRVNNMVINRCRKPANADILVPGDAITVIGTTSDRVPIESVDDMHVTPEEVEVLLSEGAKLAPALATTRILRAYAGVRPLVASDNDPSGRSISRGIVCLDHETRDGLAGFITITGGKLMTYRMMAEVATDMACSKLGVQQKCQTATTPLPGSDKSTVEEPENHLYAFNARVGRHGTLAPSIAAMDDYQNSLVCECEEVSVGEVAHAIENMHVRTLTQLRRRVRLGMGTCQGELCALRAAGILCASCKKSIEEEMADLAEFLNERWKGMYPVGWGSTLSEAQLTSIIYQDLCGITSPSMKDRRQEP
ncbi:MAG: anaerobic glycerol-3-phosphate dehydrogenase subunit A [Bacteroidaceae bacterium]|nr:anaerobic glycerol-3-phosphate dehydrogenase subunit A [Bacteroidaceae bacterium]